MAHHIDEVLNDSNAESDTITWPGGTGTLLAQGSFGGMVAILKFQVTASTWTTVTTTTGAAASLSANGMHTLQVCPCTMRVELTGAGTDPSVAVRVAPAHHGWFLDESLL
jgi:hypothetical protein